MLSKLSLLFPNNTAELFGVDNEKIRNVGVAIMQRIGPFSQGGGVWENFKKVIGSMLLWLEKSKSAISQTVADKTSPVPQTRNAFEHIASKKGEPTSLSGAIEEVDIHQDTWPIIEFPGQLDAAAYIEAHAAMDWNTSLWQGMLESLSRFSTSVDGTYVFKWSYDWP